MAGTGPNLVAGIGVIDHRAEERRFQRFGIGSDVACKILGDKIGKVFGQEDIAGDQREHAKRNFLKAVASDQDENRHFQPAGPNPFDESVDLYLSVAVTPFQQQTAKCGIAADRHLGIIYRGCFGDRVAETAQFGQDIAQMIGLKRNLPQHLAADEDAKHGVV